MSAASSGHPGLLLVISGPSGVGKTTITRAITERFDAVFSVSATTRPKTAADVEGRDYFFQSPDEFQRKIEQGEFLEHANVFGRCYGTPRGPVEASLAKGRVVVLEIDVQGALQVRRSMPDAFMIFILPPDETTLERRLRTRARDSEEDMQRRLGEARKEISVARDSGAYDRLIINETLEQAIAETTSEIEAELERRRAAASRTG
ncbi:MAG: guanylate kinase [Phycisphaerales bacterium]